MPQYQSIALIPVTGHNPEDVLVLPDGTLITGLENGDILQVGQDGTLKKRANTGGRPLGLERFPNGDILICDSRAGLLRLDLNSGEITILTPPGDRSLSFCNNPSIAQDGRIFFTDSSQRYGFQDADKDIGEYIPTGRFLCRYPDGRVEILKENLHFANGVALAPDERFVLVAETGSTRINRLWLRGPQAGSWDIFTDTLPGLPDNLNLGTDGLIWVALVANMTDTLRRLWRAPAFLRTLLVRLPDALSPRPADIGLLAGLDLEGNILHQFSTDPAQFNTITSVREHNGSLYLGSINSNAIGRLDLKF